MLQSGDNKELERLKETRGMLMAISAVVGSKKLTARTLSRRQKAVISEATGKDVHEINQSIESFTKMRHMHAWLKDRKAKGLPMPTSQEEAQVLMQTDIAMGNTSLEGFKEEMEGQRKMNMKKQTRLAGKGR